MLSGGNISKDTPGIIYLYAKEGSNAEYQDPLYVRRGFFAADLNGDGMDDIIFGAPKKYRARYFINAGEAYLVYGERQMPAVINVFETGTPTTKYH